MKQNASLGDGVACLSVTASSLPLTETPAKHIQEQDAFLALSEFMSFMITGPSANNGKPAPLLDL